MLYQVIKNTLETHEKIVTTKTFYKEYPNVRSRTPKHQKKDIE